MLNTVGKDHCYPYQTALALLCKSSTRTVQNYTAELVKAEYIAVKKDKKTGRNIYYLLPSPPTCLTQEARHSHL